MNVSKTHLKTYIYLLSFFIGLNFTTPVFAAFCQSHYGLDGSGITSLFACFSLSVFLFEMPTGVLSDRLGEKRSLVIGSALSLMSMLLFLSGSTMLLFLGEFTFGVGSTFFSGPFDSIIYKYCRMLDDGRSFEGVISTSYSLQWSALGASFLGCFLLTRFGSIHSAFWGTVVVQACLLAITLSLPATSDESASSSSSARPIRALFESLSQGRLWVICALNIAFTMVLTSGYLILQPYLLESGIDTNLNGVLYFIAAAFACVGSLLYEKLKMTFTSHRNLMITALGIIAACLFGLSGLSGMFFVFLFVCVYRFVWGISSPMFSSLVNRSIEDDSYRNTSFSLISLGSNLCVSLLLFLFSFCNLRPGTEYLALGVLSLLLVVTMYRAGGKRGRLGSSGDSACER